MRCSPSGAWRFVAGFTLREYRRYSPLLILRIIVSPSRFGRYFRILHLVAGSKRRPFAPQDVAIAGIGFRPSLYPARRLAPARTTRRGAAVAREEILESFVVVG